MLQITIINRLIDTFLCFQQVPLELKLLTQLRIQNKKIKLTLEASKSIFSHLVVKHLNQALGICLDHKLTYENDKHDERMID